MASYTQLEPAAFQSLGITTNTSFNGADVSFFTTTSFLYTLCFIAIVGAAFYRYVLVGVYRMEASESGIRKSNETFKKTTLGLLGVFALFLIIATLNSQLLTGNVGLEELQSKPAAPAAPVTQSSGGTTGTNPIAQAPSGVTNPTIPTNNNDPVGWGAISADPVVRTQLRSLPNGGITVNKNVCQAPTLTQCTTVGGWPAETPSMLATLRQTCGGNIEVTGGTEAGHSSHGPGRTAVDLSLNDSTLEACIRSFPVGPQKSFCRVTYIKFGYLFCDELGVRHWHVYQQ